MKHRAETPLSPRRAGVAALLLLLASALPAAAATHSMTAMPNFTFEPASLTINQGDTVNFSNLGGFHNVLASGAATFRCANGCDDQGGDGNASAAAWSFSRTFSSAGTVNISCQVHASSGMTAVITVVGGGGGNPGQLQLVSGSASRSENGGSFTVQVQRSSGTDGAVSVDYATSDGSAAAGSDYSAVAGTLSFASGAGGTQNVNVPILDDGGDENDETINFSLSNPTGGATLGSPSTATLTIVDDDTGGTPVPGTLGFSASSYQVAENGGNATITVGRSGGSSGAVSVNYSSSNGSGTAGNDYTPVAGTLTWSDGDSASKSFQVPILDDSAADGNKTVNLLLQNPGGGASLGTSGATLTITDNEQRPCVAGERVLCLGENNRFEVKVHWMDFAGNMDDAIAVTIGKRDSGLFYFFDQNNIEMLVKVLNGCGINNRFWVFYAATTNVAFHVEVRDTVTGFVKSFDNSLGTSAPPVNDTDFEACP